MAMTQQRLLQFTNSEGQPVEFIGTIDQALEQGLNVNCTNCTDCTSCTGCTGCTGCDDCDDCLSCTNCTSCANCTQCFACTDCTGCSKHQWLASCPSQPIAAIHTETWPIVILSTDSAKPDTVKIGCQRHSVKDWLAFTDEQLSNMDSDAVRFRDRWRATVLTIIQPHDPNDPNDPNDPIH